MADVQGDFPSFGRFARTFECSPVIAQGPLIGNTRFRVGDLDFDLVPGGQLRLEVKLRRLAVGGRRIDGAMEAQFAPPGGASLGRAAGQGNRGGDQLKTGDSRGEDNLGTPTQMSGDTGFVNGPIQVLAFRYLRPGDLIGSHPGRTGHLDALGLGGGPEHLDGSGHFSHDAKLVGDDKLINGIVQGGEIVGLAIFHLHGSRFDLGDAAREMRGQSHVLAQGDLLVGGDLQLQRLGGGDHLDLDSVGGPGNARDPGLHLVGSDSGGRGIEAGGGNRAAVGTQDDPGKLLGVVFVGTQDLGLELHLVAGGDRNLLLQRLDADVGF